MNKNLILTIAALAALMLLGCSEKSTRSSLSTGFISGHVTIDGQPATGAVITVTPYVIIDNGSTMGKGETPFSASAAGDYQIEMPPGSYKVTFSINDQYRNTTTSRYPVEVSRNQTTTLNVEMREPAVVNLLAIETDAQVRLTFEGGYNALSYHIFRSPAAGNSFEQIADTVYLYNSFSDFPSAVGSYKYKIIAVNSLGETPPSNEAYVNLTGIPLAPSNFRAEDLVRYVHLSWQSYYDNRNFNIYRSATGRDWTLLATTSNYACSDTPSTYDTYQYRIKAVSQYDIESSASPVVSVNFDGRPDPPSGLRISDRGNYIYLVWDDLSYETDYKIYRAFGDGDFTPLTATSYRYYSDTPAQFGIYRYKVSSLMSDELESDQTAEVSVNFDGRFDPPQDVSARLYGFLIVVSCTDNGPVDFHNVYRSVDNGQNYEWLALTRDYWEDRPAVAGAYFYRMSATAGDGASESDMSAPVQVYFSGEAAAPDLYYAQCYGRSIQVSWQSVHGADGYSIYRAADSNGNYVMVGESTTYGSYSDTPDSAGDYYYKVRASTRGGLVSAMSRPRHVYFTGIPLAPSTPNVYDRLYNVGISWSYNGPPPDLFIVYRLNTQTQQYIPIDSTLNTILFDWPSAPGTYWYKVQAKQDGYYSELSLPAWTYFSAVLETPRMFYCQDQGPTVAVTWYGVEGADKFNVFRGTSRDNLAYLTEISGSNGFMDTPPAEGWYFYAVSAETRGGIVSQRCEPDSVYYTP